MQKNAVLTPNDVSEYLKVSRVTVINEIKAGKLKANRVGKQWRILQSDLQKYLNVE